MELSSLPTEIILTHSQQILANLQLDWTPQPGSYLELEGKTYAVLERHHRYHLRSGRYHLHKIALYVQSAPCTTERSLVAGRWIIGDASCKFSAHSELLRCAVNPEGPCGISGQGWRCRFYEPRSEGLGSTPASSGL
ncbi:hypothetical protein DO97_17990 [Neosynechococcus sphagnicola sy1]|uniref:Uncharacterized protein n=1 Tax=Neosynechococcus sphagnicola sy1 TaxID=1497020 RepID=A0A098THQ4_9CYAN|nr:DUF6464 family protein [Neosynechococcus sphagnicola]KGF71517.1 hypothetical protein DO97_17990 [Neosynechococcus sphagnicola sy1]